MSARTPTVVVAGRPNVGKSALVNRLAGRRITVVEEHPGVTRDRKVVPTEWSGVAFDVVDTGGWLPGGDTLDEKVSEQAAKALEGADLVLFVVDVTVGVTDEDLAAARRVQRTGRPVRLVVNKVDDEARERQIWEFVALGLGEPIAVSALHGRQAGDLLDAIVASLAGWDAPDVSEDREEGGPLRVAIVGRPNVGKSTLFNALIGEDRSVVHDVPGTTRDAVDTVLDTPDGPICFVDTAGMRRRARTEAGVETYAVLRSLEALNRADLALLVIDATVRATAQDQRLAERIAAAGCPAVVVLNKWDLIATEARTDVLATVADRLAFLGDAPVLKVAALSGRGVHRVLPALAAAAADYHRRIPTGPLNRALRDLQAHHAAPGARVRYVVQGAIDPPTFTLFASARLSQTYLRYLERGLRERFDLGATPLRLRVRIG
ncbi:MAG TPA: ribosome biogenesis GTPase Der [Acidimicrobiales bacterium]|nr:ribosome biogenesis GTPase Der [Acidimicrobiales bacterium]